MARRWSAARTSIRRTGWTGLPSRADRATAIALISEARAQFEAAEAAPGTAQTPDPLRGRWGAKCDLGYIEWSDGLQTSWSTFGGTEKRGISQYKQLGSRFTIVFEGGYTQFYDIVANDQIVLSGVGAQGALTGLIAARLDRPALPALSAGLYIPIRRN